MADAVKSCRSCGVPIDEANTYSSNRSACKECVKTQVRQNRAAKKDYYRAYDRMRYHSDPERKEACQANARAHARDRSEWAKANRKKNPEKYRARNAVNNALRDGKIKKAPCFFCGSIERVTAHHEDYSHPLDVVWLCPACHGKLHTIRGDFRRAV